MVWDRWHYMLARDGVGRLCEGVRVGGSVGGLAYGWIGGLRLFDGERGA